MANKKEEKVIELAKGKPRKEEEKFFVNFSERQLTAVLLIVLAATFLVQGTIRYLDAINKLYMLENWFPLVLSSVVFLAISVLGITVGGITAPLKMKRVINEISFFSYVLGFFIFLASLIILILIVFP